MKKILSLLLMVSMLVAVIPFTAMASETESASTLTEYLSYDFDTDSDDFDTQMKYYDSTIDFAQYFDRMTDESGTYGIGAYRYLDKGGYLPIAVDEDGAITGFERFTTPNLYLEIEYDYMPVDKVHNYSTTNKGTGNLGISAVTYNSSSSLAHTNSFGSLYHIYTWATDTAAGTTQWGYKSSTPFDNCIQTPTLDKWHRVKIVAQLTNDTLQTDSTTKYKIPTTNNSVKTYVDGVLINEKKSAATSIADEYVRVIRFQQGYAYAGLDNLTVRTYQAGDAPVDKGALIAAIRNFEAANSNYVSFPAAVKLIDEAKAVYNKADATASDVTAAIAKVQQAAEENDPYYVVYEQDFEDNNYDAYLTSIKNTYGNSSDLSDRQSTDNEVFAIGKYENRTTTFVIPLTEETETITIGTTNTGTEEEPVETPVTATVPKGIKIQGNNFYVQTEFDYKINESTPGTNCSYSAGGMLLSGFRTDKNPYELLSGQAAYGTVYHQYDPSDSSAVLTTYAMASSTSSKVTSSSGQYIGDADVNKWHRVKIVAQVTNSSGDMSTSNKIYFYVDGQLVNTKYLNSSVVNNSDGYIRFLRQHLSYGRQAIDNISVVTYNDLADAPVDKGALVAEIRDFEADYPSYTSSDRAVELLNAAKAVYNNSDATPDNVTEAITKVNTARNIFNPENGIAVYCDGEKIIVNGSVSSETALDDEYRTILAYFGENDELLTVEMSEGAKVEAGNNPVYFESELYFPYQRVVAYVWTTNTLIPLCTPVSDTFTALKVLAIGNSFSQDAMTYLYQIAENSGEFDVILLANAYIGGCSLEKHKNNIDNDTADYSYEIYGTKKTSTADQTLETIIKDQKWNLITLQQNSSNSGVADTYSYLPGLISWVKENKTNPHAKLAWHMTWAYSQEKLNTYSKYDQDQMTMYNAIVSAVQSEVLTNDDISFIIPTGTAIQNLRTSDIDESLITRDGQHVGHEVGRYAAGLTWFKKITGLSIDNITYIPGDYVSSTADDGNDIADVNEETLPIIKKCVNNAINTPLAVTQYTE